MSLTSLVNDGRRMHNRYNFFLRVRMDFRTPFEHSFAVRKLSPTHNLKLCYTCYLPVNFNSLILLKFKLQKMHVLTNEK